MITAAAGTGRSVLLMSSAGDALPDGIAQALRGESIGAGFVSGAGVVSDVELRTIAADGRTITRKFAGASQLVALRGRIGAGADAGLSAVLARETEGGLQTFAGVLVKAQVLVFEAWVSEIDIGGAAPSPPARPAGAAAPPAPPAPPASPVATPGPTLNAQGPMMSSPIPQRPARPSSVDSAEGPTPEVGDVVEHFAFGTCEVVSTDGDRINLRLAKDGRIKEIAPEMLRVTPLDLTSQPRRFKLDRKL